MHIKHKFDIYLNALSVVSAYDGLKRFIILPINQSAFAIGNNSNPFINNTSIPANSYKKMIAIKGVARNPYSSYLRGQVSYVAIVGNNTRAVHNTTTYTTSYNQEIDVEHSITKLKELQNKIKEL